MGRPKTKEDLVRDAIDSYKKLNLMIDNLTEEELNTPFDFSTLNRSEKHWVRDKNLRDIIIHLYEWQVLMINWMDSNTKGIEKPFLLDGYTWKNYDKMNQMFWEKHQNTSLDKAKELLDDTNNKVMSLLDNYNTEELFTKGYYKWVGSSLGQYFISVTLGHYDWAMTKLKAHKKILQNKKI